MRTPTEPLRQEHRQIRSRLASIRALADRVDDMSASDVATELVRTVAFLSQGLVPHALAEEEVLYPVVARAMGADRATATMSRDHLEIVRLADQLGYLTHRFHELDTKRMHRDLRQVLYAIEAIATLHLDEEEEIYLPLLDGYLTEEAADEMFASLHAAADRAKQKAQ